MKILLIDTTTSNITVSIINGQEILSNYQENILFYLEHIG